MPSFTGLADRIRRLPPRLGPVRLVAVDGPSGAGKTRFAARLGAALACRVVHTDDLLDGWDDQFTFWPRLERLVLGPLRRGGTARYERYLWHRKRFGGVPVTVAPDPVVVLEGVSSARALIAAELSLAVFVQAPAEVRRQRVLTRDLGAESDPLGEHEVAFRAYLERWRAAEDRHFATDATAARADLVVDGTTVGDDSFTTVPAEPASRCPSSENGDGR